MSNDLLMTLARPSFSPEFVQWLATAPIRDIEEAYCENYKEAYGIKARWVFDSNRTREQWADDFVQLGNDIRDENERAAEYEAAEQERVAWENEHESFVRDPEPLPYEHMLTDRYMNL